MQLIFGQKYVKQYLFLSSMYNTDIYRVYYLKLKITEMWPVWSNQNYQLLNGVAVFIVI